MKRQVFGTRGVYVTPQNLEVTGRIGGLETGQTLGLSLIRIRSWSHWKRTLEIREEDATVEGKQLVALDVSNQVM